MKIDKVFVDTNIPMYAAGKDHEHKKPCLELLELIADGKLLAFTDAEVFQEILHRFIALKNSEAGFQIFDNFYNLIGMEKILPITAEDVMKTKKLAQQYTRARARDLLHLAVMINHDLRFIVTVDAHFEEFKEVERMDPKKHLRNFGE